MGAHASPEISSKNVPNYHSIDRVFQIQYFAPGVDLYLLAQVSQGHRFCYQCDRSYLICQIRSQFIHDAGQLPPGSLNVQDLRESLVGVVIGKSADNQLTSACPPNLPSVPTS